MTHEQFTPLFEYPPEMNIVLVERGHHLQHIFNGLDQYKKHPQQDVLPLLTAKNTLEEFSRMIRYHEGEIENLQHLREVYMKVINFPWFRKFFSVVLQNATWITAEIYKWDKTKEMQGKDIDVAFRYLIAYSMNQLNSNFFKLLQRPHRWLDLESLTILQDWNADTSQTDTFLKNHPELQSVTYEEMRLVIHFFMEVIGAEFQNELFMILALFSEELFLKAIDEIQRKNASEIAYFNDIRVDSRNQEDSDATTNRYINFTEKIIQLSDQVDSWVILNTLPGELCKINGTSEAPECGRHCLRMRNAHGDQNVLDMIEMFAQDHPEHGKEIVVIKSANRVVEIALRASILQDKEFASIFDAKFKYR